MIYLASPHSHTSPAIRHQRWRAAVDCQLHYLAHGIPLYSPIALWHPIETQLQQRHNRSLSHSFMLDSICYPVLDVCNSLWVYCYDGWDTSLGIAREVNWALDGGKSVAYVLPDPYRVRDGLPEGYACSKVLHEAEETVDG